ncbi:MAG: hypothetical protein E7614_08450 [Ruminococcaceae bacterium]|nr:hypothetical protein [Oscillospiraceae bacterium]
MKRKSLIKFLSMMLASILLTGAFSTTSLAVGDNIKDPVICTSFSEFKAAMENEEITYVSLGNTDELLPVVEGEGVLAAIYVKGTKRLNLTGYSKFTAPTTGKVYDCLLQVSGSELYVQGSGQLAFASVGKQTSNAVIRNIGGRITIYDGYLRGYFHAGTYSMAICQDYGELKIFDGFFYSENGDSINGEDNSTYSVYVADGTAEINGGNFSTSNYANAQGYGYSLFVGPNADVTISGGTFYGIQVPYANRLSDYISEGLVMSYSGEKTDPAEFGTITGNIEIEVYREITSVDININAPSNGSSISNRVYNIPEGAYFHTANWYEDGVPVDTSDKFVAGKSYKVMIYLLTDDNAKFANNLTSTTINYSKAKIIDYSNDKEISIGLEMDFGICPENIYSVEATIDPPMEHYTPDQYVSCGSEAYKQALAGDNMFDTPLQWQESTDGKNWSVMKATDKFSVGKYYKVFIDLMVNGNYKFATNSQFDPQVNAKVNGNTATVSRYTEEDPEKLISVCYNFGILNDNVIEEIRIDGVTEPVVGEKPSYDCAISGVGYTVNTAYSNNTYVINGICWRDTTDDKWVYPKDTFQIGHKYKVFIDVKTDNGYEFYTSGNSYKPAGWGYIDNNYATFGVQSDARFEQSLSWEYTCQPKTISSIAVDGLETPADGNAPDFNAMVDSDYYTIESIIWYDCENDMVEMTSDDAFAGGNQYYVLITVVPTEEDGNKLCKFVSDKTTASLNGVNVKKIPGDSWQDVTSAVKRVNIWYTFKKATSENDMFISGQVKTFKDENNEVTVELYKEHAFTPEYRTYVKGNNASYHFASVDPGTYTLKVSKENHVTAEYTITVTNNSVIQNVETWLYGDVTGDGIVDSTDFLRIKGHFLGTYKLSGLGLLSGDVTKEGVIDSTDFLRIKGHFLGTYNLYK